MSIVVFQRSNATVRKHATEAGRCIRRVDSSLFRFRLFAD